MKKAFTLVEMVVAVTILSLILTVVISIYFQMQKLRTDIFAKSVLIKNTNSLVEKINILMKNYDIDYEEYFNRRIVGCVGNNGGDNFTWNVGLSGYCSDFTAYGNENSVSSSSGDRNILYYCTSKGTENYPDEIPGGDSDCEGNNGDGISGENYIYYQQESDLYNGSGCWENIGGAGKGNGKKQSFGEYKLQFWDVKKNADAYGGCYGDDDDLDMGIGPVAIGDNLHVKELYLISKDGRERIFIRRKLVKEEDFNHDGTIETGERLYKLQMLKLRGFDIGADHNFTTYGPYAHDGKIDTWACDKSQGFICHGNSIDPNGGLKDYRLPKDENDGWVDLTINDLTILNFDLAIFPTINPNYGWQQNSIQIYPYLRLNLTTQFYPTNYKTKLNPSRLMKYKMNLQTTFSIKPY